MSVVWMQYGPVLMGRGPRTGNKDMEGRGQKQEGVE